MRHTIEFYLDRIEARLDVVVVRQKFHQKAFVDRHLGRNLSGLRLQDVHPVPRDRLGGCCGGTLPFPLPLSLPLPISPRPLPLRWPLPLPLPLPLPSALHRPLPLVVLRGPVRPLHISSHRSGAVVFGIGRGGGACCPPPIPPIIIPRVPLRGPASRS